MDIYETIKTIGSGSFGQVYLARHKREGKHYVIKRVKTRDMSQKDLENTENEVRLLQKIRHTNIVAYKDSYVDREQFLNIVMVYCDGGDIYSKIKASASKGKNFTETQIVDWLAQMSLALLYLHERKILHRDMKTQNIFLKNGKIRLGDFGIARVLDNTKDFANTCIGTPYYMSPELFKAQAYSYKSDVWALGCVLYEMCNLRHAFDAQSIHGLSVKILRGSYPPINTMYSKSLRDLISKMLSVKPQQRPSILDILNKMFVRKRVTSYLNDCLNGPPDVLEPTDVDDMFVDSLKEQAEKLMIPGFSTDKSTVGRLVAGKGSAQLKRVKKIQQEVKKSGAMQHQRELQTDQEKRKEVARLKKEIDEKERIEKKLKELEEEQKSKEQQYKEKYQAANKRRQQVLNAKKEKASRASKPPIVQGSGSGSGQQTQQRNSEEGTYRSNSVPAQRNKITKHISSQHISDDRNEIIEEQKGEGTLQQHASEVHIDLNGKKQKQGRPHAHSFTEDDDSSPNLQTPLVEGNSAAANNGNNSAANRIGSKPSNVSSHSQLLTDGPLNTYQDFRNVFNARHLGPKSNRRQAAHAPNYLSSENLKENEERSIRSSSHSIKGTGQVSGAGPNIDHNLKNQSAQEAQTARDRVIKDKNAKKRADQDRHEQELQNIRDQNQNQRKDAETAQKNQYRTTTDQKNQKKIEEDYSMFDEQQAEEEELEDIIEQPIEEESGEGESEDEYDDAGGEAAMAESKAQRMLNKEELMQLKTQVLEMKEELARKTNNIESIRDTLKVNKVKVERSSGQVFDIEASLDDNEIDQAVKEFEYAQDEQQSVEDANEEDDDLIERPDLNDSDNDDENFGFDDGDNDDEDDDEYGNEQNQDQAYRDQFGQEQDPQVLKLNDKLKLFRHRCVASLGNNLYERAIEFIKEQVDQSTSTDERRNGLIAIIGEESIGLWAILDQILFYEDLISEIKSLSQLSSQASTNNDRQAHTQSNQSDKKYELST